MELDDTYDLGRFIQAQESGYTTALAELRDGKKRTHWIWFVFPQLRGLGSSAMSWKYGLSGLREAQAYAIHPVLGPRLRECVTATLRHRTLPVEDLLGGVDALKFRSCLTLFARAAPEMPEFARALRVFFDGRQDPATVQLLEHDEPGCA